MSDVAIRVENLGKMYRIGGKQERYQTFRDTLTNALISPFKKAHALLGGQAYGASNLSEDMWALKDVSFEIKQGEVVGIIGRNGAGKSTLLKILSRITEPTSGYVDIYGRVGALLEVGTGFHPELTGRENIYLNGTILGMSRKEIQHKFDEIIDFSGVEKFVDTPVKHYSSGMGLRLGFAIAAYMEPHILVVDEVLAVGDAEFQKKCLGKMSDVASQGRTVLFVSHDMGAVRRLCQRGIVLSSGKNVFDGTANNSVNFYLSGLEKSKSTKIDKHEGPFFITSVRLKDCEGNEKSRFSRGTEIHLEINATVTEKLPPTHININFFYNGTLLFRTFDSDSSSIETSNRTVGQHNYIFKLDTELLKAGSYILSMDTGIKPYTMLQTLDNVISFELYDPNGDFDKAWSEKRQGFIKAPGEWYLGEYNNKLPSVKIKSGAALE